MQLVFCSESRLTDWQTKTFQMVLPRFWPLSRPWQCPLLQSAPWWALWSDSLQRIVHSRWWCPLPGSSPESWKPSSSRARWRQCGHLDRYLTGQDAEFYCLLNNYCKTKLKPKVKKIYIYMREGDYNHLTSNKELDAPSSCDLFLEGVTLRFQVGGVAI